MERDDTHFHALSARIAKLDAKIAATPAYRERWHLMAARRELYNERNRFALPLTAA